MQTYEAIEKWYAEVCLVFTFLQWRLYEAQRQGQPLCLVADVIRQHRAEHAQAVLIAACQEAIRTGAIEPILERFIAWPLAA